MKIVMIGHSGVGKTTYMAALYSYFNPYGFLGLWRKAHRVYGYHVRAIPETAHDHLSSLASIIEKGGFPTATDRQTQYQFAVNFKSEDNFFVSEQRLPEFTWIDYRGGALRERQEGNREVSSLLNEIKSADAIMIFADSEALLSGTHMQVRREIASMTNLLTSAFSESQKRLAIVIALTKKDLLRGSNVDCWEPFQPLLLAISQTDRAVALRTEVSCIKPMQNVQLPLLFCLGANVTIEELSIQEDINRIHSQMNQLRGQANEAQNKATLGNDIWVGLTGWATGEESFTDQSARLHAKAQEELVRAQQRQLTLQPLCAPANQIRNLLLHNQQSGQVQFYGNIKLLGLIYK